MRNNPLYHAGAVAFSVSAGIPKVGVLLESVWNMNDSCRFQLRSPESLKNMDKTTKTQEIKSVRIYVENGCIFLEHSRLHGNTLTIILIDKDLSTSGVYLC